MIKIIEGHIVRHWIYDIDDNFKVKFKIYYRYNIFNFKKIDIEIDIDEIFTLRKAYESVGIIINDLNKITKI